VRCVEIWYPALIWRRVREAEECFDLSWGKMVECGGGVEARNGGGAEEEEGREAGK
jgi:hypothetical protein